MSDDLNYMSVAANGLNFNVAHAGSGSKLALCLHGFPELAYSWRHQLPMLAELGYRAWAPDMRGYGETDRPVGVDNYTMEHLVADVVGLIEAADADEVVLMAHDWGAAIAWHVAMRHPEVLGRLVIMNVPHPKPFERELKAPKQMLKSWYILFFQIPWLPEKLLAARGAKAIGDSFTKMAVHKDRFSQADMAVYQRAAQQPGALTAMINYYRAALRNRSTMNDPSPVIETPTLMIWGEQDTALDKATTVGTNEWVSNLTLRYLPNASHWVQQDQPDVVNQMLAAWLQSEPVPEASELERTAT